MVEGLHGVGPNGWANECLLRYKLVVKNSTKPKSKLEKKCKAIASYHCVCKVQGARCELLIL